MQAAIVFSLNLGNLTQTSIHLVSLPKMPRFPLQGILWNFISLRHTHMWFSGRPGTHRIHWNELLWNESALPLPTAVHGVVVRIWACWSRASHLALPHRSGAVWSLFLPHSVCNYQSIISYKRNKTRFITKALQSWVSSQASVGVVLAFVRFPSLFVWLSSHRSWKKCWISFSATALSWVSFCVWLLAVYKSFI